MVACGGEVWVGDETTVREYPPLRAGWSQRGSPANVVISGRNAQRVIHGALNIATGEFVTLVQPRSRTAEVVATVEALGQLRPDVPKLLVWDNAPAHHPKRVATAAHLAGIDLAFLPFRSPELMPLEETWRGAKAVVAANRCYASVDEAADRTVTWLHNQSGEERLRRCGLRSSKFQWLPT
jgi:transposase